MSATTLLIILAAVVGVAAAIRSIWSPCGLSMLSTITPIGERGRNNTFRGTATWFVIGAVLGGASLGLVTAGLAAVVSAFDLSSGVVLGAAAVLAAVVAISDSKVLGVQLPIHRRQVNEDWLDQYRSWVYGGGFGWQIGVGFGTYIMTAAVYLFVVLAALTASPLVAFGLSVLFGLVRGLAVLLGARITSPAALLAFHRRFDAIGPVVRQVVIAIESGVTLIAATAAWGIGGSVVVLVGLAGFVVVATLSGSPRRQAARADIAAN